jgi:hypothetical protein
MTRKGSYLTRSAPDGAFTLLELERVLAQARAMNVGDHAVIRVRTKVRGWSLPPVLAEVTIPLDTDTE